jgi:type I restriction enzyme, S subunit
MSASATVPEDYKQTEIGVFPKDWQIKKFGDIFDFKSTASNSRSDLTETDEAHYIHYGDIHTIFHRHLDISKKSTPRIDLSLCKNAPRIRNGDWVMADASEDFSGICKAIEISGIDEDKSVVAGLHTFLLRDKNKEYSPGFKGHLGEAKFLHDQYVRVSVGLKVFGVTKTSLRDLLIPVPPKTQQTKIEEILTEADAQIQSFEHLVAKKRDIKQGTMQELLTGKTRLPGFNGDWIDRKISELFEVSAGGDYDKTNSRKTPTHSFHYPIYANNISNNGIHGYCNYFTAKAGSITITARGTLGIARYRSRPFVAIVRLLVLEPLVNIDARFFAEYINNYVNFPVESTGVPQLTVPQVITHIVPVPCVKEQEAIAEILTDMDTEIAALEERLEKAKAIKQGMMQQLLTGKIRLVD